MLLISTKIKQTQKKNQYKQCKFDKMGKMLNAFMLQMISTSKRERMAI